MDQKDGTFPCVLDYIPASSGPLAVAQLPAGKDKKMSDCMAAGQEEQKTLTERNNQNLKVVLTRPPKLLKLSSSEFVSRWIWPSGALR